MQRRVYQDVPIGHNIRRLRKKAGLSQVEVVSRMQIMGCQISRTSYVKIESGTHSLRVSELAALTNILNTDYNEIFAVVATAPDA